MIEEWRGLLNGVLYVVQFSPVLDSSEADRVARMIREQPLFGWSVQRQYDALAAALASDADLSTGIPQPHPDAAVRTFLSQVLTRLA